MAATARHIAHIGTFAERRRYRWRMPQWMQAAAGAAAIWGAGWLLWAVLPR